MPNVRLGYDFNETWGVEANLGFLNPDKNSHYPNGSQGTLATVAGIYRFTPYKMLEPYVIAGIGVITLDPNQNSAVHQGNVNAGIGSQLFVNDSIAFRGEVKDVYTMSGGKNDFLVNLGMSFLFGGETPKAPASFKS